MLNGKSVIFFGSSVTYGNDGYSFVEMLAQRNALTYIKEAVSGTALADTDGGSYVARIKKIPAGFKADAFICQLSTNDAGRNLPLGRISEGFEYSCFDAATTDGAIEFIAKYVADTWGCPLFFYTGTVYESNHYKAMVGELKKLSEKWGFGIIDLWNDKKMNSLSPEKVAEYMKDPVHPTTAGYLNHWVPFMEEYLNKAL